MWLLKEKPASPIFILYHLFLNSFRYQCAALGTESGLFTVTCCLCLSTQHIRLTKQVLFNTVFLGQPVCCKILQIYPELQIKPGTIRCLNFTQMPTILSIFTSLPSYDRLPSCLYSPPFLPIFASLPSYIHLYSFLYSLPFLPIFASLQHAGRSIDAILIPCSTDPVPTTTQVVKEIETRLIGLTCDKCISFTRDQKVVSEVRYIEVIFVNVPCFAVQILNW